MQSRCVVGQVGTPQQCVWCVVSDAQGRSLQEFPVLQTIQGDVYMHMHVAERQCKCDWFSSSDDSLLALVQVHRCLVQLVIKASERCHGQRRSV